MSEITTIGLDLAKHDFQVHGIDAQGTTVLRKQLRRGQVLAFFSRIPRCVVGLEACATAHYWARELGALGHEVRLMPAQYVKAYIKRNKHDAADAEAICEEVGRPTMRFVPVKTAEQQATQLLHRGREQLVRQRTMLVNALRAHLIGRREFITLLGGAAAAWPLAARAQQAMPVVGFLEIRSPETIVERLRAFRQGLRETGYVEGENVTIDYRWAEQLEHLPELAGQLVRRQVAVIATAGGFATALAAKGATATIPIVFGVSEDPVKFGLVTSLARPSGNLTGVNLMGLELTAKRLELLREMLPGATRVAVLVNPANAANTQTTLHEVEAAAGAMGLQIQIFNTSTSREIDAAFAAFGRERPDAVFVGQDAFYNGRRVQLANWASRHALPMTSGSRDICEVGGIMSYGANIVDTYRQEGVYTGRILKGAKPADLPVVQSAKFEFVINAQTARMLGVDIPANLLARADEVIE